jgi:SAM-dependent methyltransferase
MLAPTAPRDLAAWNQALNQTHAMSLLRQRGGRVVRAVEGRRRGLVAAAVLRGPHRRVVDLGAEDGWIAEGYAARVPDLLLVDVDPDVLARAPLARRSGVRTAVADATDPASLRSAIGPVAPDVVVVSALLEHLPRPGPVVGSLLGLLAPRGRLVVYVPADGPILTAKAILRLARLGGLVRGLPLTPAPGHLHRFDRRRLARLLGAAGRVRALRFHAEVLGYLAVVSPRSGR